MYILIITIIGYGLSSNGYSGNPEVVTQEFTSEETCLEAGKKWENEVKSMFFKSDGGKIKFICVKK